MFGQISYVLRFNHALAILGVNPQHINETIRQSAQISGKEFGATPKEMALVLASQLPLEYTIQLDPRTAMNWIRKRKNDCRLRLLVMERSRVQSSLAAPVFLNKSNICQASHSDAFFNSA